VTFTDGTKLELLKALPQGNWFYGRTNQYNGY
jgi:hypothetical protein